MEPIHGVASYFYAARNSVGLFLTTGRFLPFNEPSVEKVERFDTVNKVVQAMAPIQGLDLKHITLFKVYLDGFRLVKI